MKNRETWKKRGVVKQILKDHRRTLRYSVVSDISFLNSMTRLAASAYSFVGNWYLMTLKIFSFETIPQYRQEKFAKL